MSSPPQQNTSIGFKPLSESLAALAGVVAGSKQSHDALQTKDSATAAPVNYSRPIPSHDPTTVGRIHNTRISADDNRLDRFELFLLGDGEKKVTEEVDTRVTSTSTFTFNKEDHTLGNMLRARLLQSPQVTFSGYKVPHPLVAQFILRVQTDGTITPKAALMQACKDLVNDLSVLSREFTKEWELRKMVGDGAPIDKDGKAK